MVRFGSVPYTEFLNVSLAWGLTVLEIEYIVILLYKVLNSINRFVVHEINVFCQNSTSFKIALVGLGDELM